MSFLEDPTSPGAAMIDERNHELDGFVHPFSPTVNFGYGFVEEPRRSWVSRICVLSTSERGEEV